LKLITTIIAVVVAAIGAVVGDFGLEFACLFLISIATELNLLFYLGDQTLIFLF
jgi:hypothetical protein